METVAVVGLGLIGGSFALGLREAGFGGEILGVSEPKYVDAAREAGAISRGATLEEACAAADLIYLSQAVNGIIETLQRMDPLVQANCLITDAGSTKRTIVETARRTLTRAHFLGGHPMAGKEKRGIQEAEGTLFRGRPYVLISDFASVHPKAPEMEADFCDWLLRMGASIVRMTAEQHDEVVAYSSHLPQLLSTNLARTLAAQNRGLSPSIYGQGLLDMTRLAVSSADLWSSILETNRDKILAAVEAFEAELTVLKALVEKRNIGADFEQAAEYAQRLREQLYKN